MSAVELNLDLSQPLTLLVRQATKEAHQRAMASLGGQLSVNGQLPKNLYAQFLMMLWHMYDAFEIALEQHATHPTLEPTYNPALLRRTATLASDISFLLQVPLSEWQCHPLHTSLITPMPEQLRIYIDRINLIANSPDPSALLAHSYVRYLGDLSGGQYIREVIIEAYGLDEATGLGAEFYEFKELGGSKKANEEGVAKIKEWFREGMNKGGGRNDEIKVAVMNEAKLVFDLNTGLFKVLEALVADSKKEEDTLEAPLNALSA